MTHQVLARKWRPRSFQEVLGQSPVVRALMNALDQKRLHHAYLFTGTRGVGKTSIARILAKCLNCAEGVSSTPCNHCHLCVSINNGQCVDIIEVDAASRTKVEDTLELLRNAHYAPSSGRYKIYLIDEVHMLSNHSFNALLKTLEEPPAHVKFLLATTDPQKLPATILSRCLQFHLKHMPTEEIISHLGHILSKEQIDYEQTALHPLARAAEGSMRDALSLLDQAIAYGGNKVTEKDVTNLLGSPKSQQLVDIIHYLAQSKPQDLLKITADLEEQSVDFGQTLEGLLSLLHQIAILQIAPDIPIDTYFQEKELLIQLASTFSKEKVQQYYQIALFGRRDLPLSRNPKNGFEMILLRMLLANPSYFIKQEAPFLEQTPQPSPSPILASSTIPLPKSESESESESGPIASISFVSAIPIISTPQLQTPTNPQIIHPQTSQLEWPELISKLDLTGMAHTLATHCSLERVAEDVFYLTLAAKHAPLVTAKQKERISKAIGDYFKKTTYVEITLTDNTQASPALLAERADQQAQVFAKQSLETDDYLQSFMSQFEANLVPDTIEPRS